MYVAVSTTFSKCHALNIAISMFLWMWFVQNFQSMHNTQYKNSNYGCACINVCLCCHCCVCVVTVVYVGVCVCACVCMCVRVCVWHLTWSAFFLFCCWDFSSINWAWRGRGWLHATLIYRTAKSLTVETSLMNSQQFVKVFPIHTYNQFVEVLLVKISCRPHSSSFSRQTFVLWLRGNHHTLSMACCRALSLHCCQRTSATVCLDNASSCAIDSCNFLLSSN